MIADIITVSRILFSLLLFFCPPYSFPFAALYLLCGASDVLDGFTARRLSTESEKGAALDSAADISFVFVYAVRILPALSVPPRILIWTAFIAVTKITGIVIAGRKTHRFLPEHSFGNRLTGSLLFLLPLSVYITDVKYPAVLVCTAASLTACAEILRSVRAQEPSGQK